MNCISDVHLFYLFIYFSHFNSFVEVNMCHKHCNNVISWLFIVWCIIYTKCGRMTNQKKNGTIKIQVSKYMLELLIVSTHQFGLFRCEFLVKFCFVVFIRSGAGPVICHTAQNFQITKTSIESHTSCVLTLPNPEIYAIVGTLIFYKMPIFYLLTISVLSFFFFDFSEMSVQEELVHQKNFPVHDCLLVLAGSLK